MANILCNHYKSSKKYYQGNLLLILTTYIYSSVLFHNVKIVPNKYVVSIILDLILFDLMFIYILDAFCKDMICQNKALCGYKSFSFKSLTSC